MRYYTNKNQLILRTTASIATLLFLVQGVNSYAASINLTYPESCLVGTFFCETDTSLPGIPSLERQAYVDTLYDWALAAEPPIQITKEDIELYIDQPTYQKNALSDISFNVNNNGTIEQFGFSDFEHYPLKGQMRDIVFLESMQESILRWENEYITSLASGDEFSDIFDRAIEIYKQYQYYTGEKGFLDVTTNPLLNTLLGAGNTSYGNFFTADGIVEGFTEDLFVELASTAFLENDIAAGLSGVEVTLRDPTTWKDLGKQFAGDLILDQLVKNKVIDSMSKQTLENMFTVVKAVKTGGTGLIMAPATLYYQTFSELMTSYDNASTGAYFTFYYFLMDNYPEKSANFFHSDGSLLAWQTMAVQSQTICNDFTAYLSTASNVDHVAELLCQTNNYTSGLGTWLATVDSQEVYVTSLVNLFLFIKHIDIDELKTKVAQQVALEKASDDYIPPTGESKNAKFWSLMRPAILAGTSDDTVPTVTSLTGRVWMDRNLGASRVALSPADSGAYGDLYQWGRLTDGHEKRTSAVTTVRSTTDVPGHGDFIGGVSSDYDWRNPRNINLWQGVNGVNNPCPTGFRIPTEDEFELERQSWSSSDAAGAFASPLKLVLAGYRPYNPGTNIESAGSRGYYWTSTTYSVYAKKIHIYSGESFIAGYYHAGGFSVRCIKDEPDEQIPTVTSVTGRVWMDRNLGASRVATSMTDEAAYGDLYQWGRLADGHEKRTSNIIAELSASDVPGHSFFIKITSSPYDWHSPSNDNLWQGKDGQNNPCPSGFRLPTISEFQEEIESWASQDSNGAFSSTLKLPVAGYRGYYYGEISNADTKGYYWTSTTLRNEYEITYSF
ncbi:MAG: hypothetical protein D3909_02175 [Candidatus Electrothrix sp. ATG1]|nr:hypothetical protein [Candidatus Electrothrix sp. ATG1]